MHADAYKWEGITEWSACSVTCGFGRSHRRAMCIGTPQGVSLVRPTHVPTYSPEKPKPTTAPTLFATLTEAQTAAFLNDSLVGGQGGYRNGTYVSFPPGWGLGEVARKNFSWFNETWKYLPGAPDSVVKSNFEVIIDDVVLGSVGAVAVSSACKLNPQSCKGPVPFKNVYHPEYLDVYTPGIGLTQNLLRETFSPAMPQDFQLWMSAPANHPPSTAPTGLPTSIPTELPSAVFKPVATLEEMIAKCGKLDLTRECIVNSVESCRKLPDATPPPPSPPTKPPLFVMLSLRCLDSASRSSWG